MKLWIIYDFYAHTNHLAYNTPIHLYYVGPYSSYIPKWIIFVIHIINDTNPVGVQKFTTLIAIFSNYDSLVFYEVYWVEGLCLPKHLQVNLFPPLWCGAYSPCSHSMLLHVQNNIPTFYLTLVVNPWFHFLHFTNNSIIFKKHIMYTILP